MDRTVNGQMLVLTNAPLTAFLLRYNFSQTLQLLSFEKLCLSAYKMNRILHHPLMTVTV